MNQTVNNQTVAEQNKAQKTDRLPVTLTLWVDADNCPSLARSVIQKAALNRNLALVFAANHDVPFETECPRFKMVVCPKTSGSADDYIVAHCLQSDVVITRDLPLAQRLLEKKVTVMNDRGLVFDEKNIVRLLKDRDLAIQLSAIGLNTGRKNNSYSQKEAGVFSSNLDKIISEKMRA
jgi:uncharacterized protein YaiI (UPF0178 family)